MNNLTDRVTCLIRRQRDIQAGADGWAHRRYGWAHGRYGWAHGRCRLAGGNTERGKRTVGRQLVIHGKRPGGGRCPVRGECERLARTNDTTYRWTQWLRARVRSPDDLSILRDRENIGIGSNPDCHVAPSVVRGGQAHLHVLADGIAGLICCQANVERGCHALTRLLHHSQVSMSCTGPSREMRKQGPAFKRLN